MAGAMTASMSNCGPLKDVSIVKIHDTDIPRLVDIHVSAFSKEKYVQIIYKEDEHRQVIEGLLRTQLHSKASVLAACRDNQTKEILGWLSFNSFITQEASASEDKSRSRRWVAAHRRVLQRPP